MMNSFVEELLASPHEPVDPVETRRSSFRNVNASLALEGLVQDKAQLARQEEVIQGRLTTAQAIALYVAEYKEDE
jgi:hypothetical protein